MYRDCERIANGNRDLQRTIAAVLKDLHQKLTEKAAAAKERGGGGIALMFPRLPSQRREEQRNVSRNERKASVNTVPGGKRRQNESRREMDTSETQQKRQTALAMKHNTTKATNGVGGDGLAEFLSALRQHLCVRDLENIGTLLQNRLEEFWSNSVRAKRKTTMELQ
ncbi:hypothetical protein IV203_025700 [Nitzschia inconspicua]|uniref:Uncharacterized protein n=1 Tax=Nitzschia inconspicua TaxID=303405 RepID=A0A9K3LHZ9_9STRA|nr:hypothetical protein IV203_025700 [Nitzschia inconspicua]